MKKNMNFFISLLISVQISWTPLYPIYADELQPQPSLDNIQNIESASKNLKVEGGKRLYQAQKTAEWIANKEYSKLTKEIIDPFLLAQQEVLTFEKDTSSRHSFLNKVQSFNPSDIPIDQLKFKIEGKTLKLVSYEMTDEKSNESRYRKRAEQIFRGIEAIQVTQDKELALVLDSKGRVFSIDMGLVLQQAFRSPIPLFSVFDLKSHLKASPSQEMRIEFLSRGLKPFVQQEVESSKNRNKIIPRDSQGSPLFKSGDVVVYTDGPKRSLKALLSLKQIQNQTRIGTIYLSWLIFQLTHQGQESNFSEKLQKQLRIEGDGKGLNPLETLIKNIKKENLQTKVDNFSEKIFEQIKTNPILAEVLRKHTRQSFKQNTDRYEQIHQSSQQGKDQFTISQWENSSKKIKNKQTLSSDLYKNRSIKFSQKQKRLY